jgi:hypothetical protein
MTGYALLVQGSPASGPDEPNLVRRRAQFRSVRISFLGGKVRILVQGVIGFENLPHQFVDRQFLQDEPRCASVILPGLATTSSNRT